MTVQLVRQLQAQAHCSAKACTYKQTGMTVLMYEFATSQTVALNDVLLYERVQLRIPNLT